jgi:enterochelin esterase-like enzyme
VPAKYRAEQTKEAGEVVSLTYTAHDYVTKTANTEEKTCNIYLPYGYDESEQYNIIYLVHGTDPQTVVHQNTWFYTIGVKNILDNMIYYGDIRPTIVVAPTFYSYGLYGDDTMTSIKEVTPVKKNSTENFGMELRNDIIPAVESAFSTYAEDVSQEGLTASRDHRAMAGLSNGCRITYSGGMAENFDYISWFGCYSSSVDSALILDALNSEQFADYKLNYMFNADGIYDFAYNGHKKMVDALLKSDRFTEENTEYVQIAFGYHSARSWRVGFYDSLQRFFL